MYVCVGVCIMYDDSRSTHIFFLSKILWLSMGQEDALSLKWLCSRLRPFFPLSPISKQFSLAILAQQVRMLGIKLVDLSSSPPTNMMKKNK